jgi:hypothetical protein
VFDQLIHWARGHLEMILMCASLGSIAAVAISALAVPWWIARLPSDYFARVSHADSHQAQPHAHPARRVAKNVIGVILAIAGLAMLFLPGQGLITLLIAVTLVDFPGKTRLERRLIANDSVLGALNWIRKRAGKPPFER